MDCIEALARLAKGIMGDLRTFEQRSVRAEHEYGEILTTEQLAKIIHKSAASVRSDASRNPRALPPICRLPGTKRLLFRLVDVREWLASYVTPHSCESNLLHASIDQGVARKRGRPRKTEVRS